MQEFIRGWTNIDIEETKGTQSENKKILFTACWNHI